MEEIEPRRKPPSRRETRFSSVRRVFAFPGRENVLDLFPLSATERVITLDSAFSRPFRVARLSRTRE